LKELVLLACSKVVLNPSIRKNIGEIYWPFLKPFLGMKKGEARPFFSVQKEIELTQFMAQFTNRT
jgi:hypothetical protein